MNKKTYHSLFLLIFFFWGLSFPAWSTHAQFDNFNTKNGLSDHYITTLHQDNYGWVWMGTGMGIERFDGVTFKRFPIKEADGSMLHDFIVRDFFENDAGDLFVGMEEYGLAKFNRHKECFERIILNDVAILSNVSVKSIVEDKDENLWVATKKGLQKVDFKSQTVQQFIHNSQQTYTISGDYVRKIVIDENANIWVGTRNGLDHFNPHTKIFTPYAQYHKGLGGDILDIFVDRDNRIWVGTSGNGLMFIEGGKIAEFDPIKAYDRTAKVNCILQDKSGLMWLGTRGGLFSYDQISGNLHWFQHDPLNAKSLVHNSVIGVMQDKQEDLWFATRGGVSYLVKEKQIFRNYLARPLNDHYLNNAEVYCIWEDKKDKTIYLGTENGGINILNSSTQKFKYLTKENSQLSSNCIKSIVGIGNNEVLIGTFGGGLNVYNTKTEKLESFMHDQGKSGTISDNIVWDICKDYKGTVWVGTAAGLDKFDPKTREFKHYPELDGLANGIAWLSVDDDNDIWLGSETTKVFRPGEGVIREFDEKVRGFFIDSKSNYWLMTGDKGVSLYSKEKGALKYYSKKEGLPGNLTYCMLEDSLGNLWVSTSNGLSCFSTADISFKNYYYYDGLQGNQFHYGAAYQSEKGEMYFGGMNGLTVFNPAQIIENNYSPPVYLSDFKIFNKSLEISNNKEAIINKSIAFSSEIRVPYTSNILTFEYSVLNYINSNQNQYKYMLEGFDETWNEVGNTNRATYTNLNPGSYTFKVIAGNKKEGWYNNEASVKLVIVPPFYRKTWFLILISMAVVIGFLMLFIFILKRKEAKKEKEFEKVKAQKLHELDAFKLRLFTNISHEIKTPLTLIISPLKKIIRSKIEDKTVKENLVLMERNANQLMGLVTQLLDFRKLQDGKLQVELQKGNVVRFCESTLSSFKSMMEDKGLESKFHCIQKNIYCYFDPGKLSKILNNLFSNAIKYNRRNGHVSCRISLLILDEKSHIKIEVKDSGLGISKKDVSQIFDRYYSTSKSDEYASSGIGLAFAKELVELQNGQLLVDSHEGKGSTFTVLLPFVEDTNPPKKIDSSDGISTLEYIKSKEFQADQQSKKIILLVEDNKDVRSFITSNFTPNYIVLVAINGNEGIELAIKTIPDIIISDVMMPGLNGIELCKMLKEDERTSHIPLILLTALSSLEDMKAGLDSGADDYISKPFDIDILETKIENLYTLRKSLIKKHEVQLALMPEKIKVKSPDEKFIEKTVKLIEKHMDNPLLNIVTFTDELGVSRVQLYRKINALTNMSVMQLVNDLRLKRAKQLLTEKTLNVSEVAYRVGYNDVSYFGKVFKKQYGINPTQFIKSL